MIPYVGLRITPDTAAVAAVDGGHAFLTAKYLDQLELAMRICQSFAMDTGSKIETAIRYIRANGGATASQLHSLLGLAANDLVSRELAPALNDGRLVKNGKDWSMGTTPAAPAPAPAAEPEPCTPPAPHRTKPQMALDYLNSLPDNRCTQDQMRQALGLAADGQPSSYMKTQIDNGIIRRTETGWALGGDPFKRPAPTAVSPRPTKPPAAASPEPAAPAAALMREVFKIGPPPAPKPDEPEAAPAPAPVAAVTIIPPLPFRCGIWSDGVLELRRGAEIVAELSMDEAGQVAEFIAARA